MLIFTLWSCDLNIGFVHLGKRIWNVVRKQVNQILATEQSHIDKN